MRHVENEGNVIPIARSQRRRNYCSGVRKAFRVMIRISRVDMFVYVYVLAHTHKFIIYKFVLIRVSIPSFL